MDYPLFKTKLKHKGIFDLSDAYNIAYDWIIGEGYEIQETSYSETVSGAKEVVINWKCYDKLSDYFRSVINVKFHIIGMSDVEVEKDGVKQKLNKGQFEFHVEGILQRDWKDQWEDKPFKFLRKLYDNFLIAERIEQYEYLLMGDVDDLVSYMKAYLNLSS